MFSNNMSSFNFKKMVFPILFHLSHICLKESPYLSLFSGFSLYHHNLSSSWCIISYNSFFSYLIFPCDQNVSLPHEITCVFGNFYFWIKHLISYLINILMIFEVFNVTFHSNEFSFVLKMNEINSWNFFFGAI